MFSSHFSRFSEDRLAELVESEKASRSAQVMDLRREVEHQNAEMSEMVRSQVGNDREFLASHANETQSGIWFVSLIGWLLFELALEFYVLFLVFLCGLFTHRISVLILYIYKSILYL